MSGPPRGPRPHCLMAEQTQGWKWGQYRRSLPYHTQLMPYSTPASQLRIAFVAGRRNLIHTSSILSLCCFHRRLQHMVLCNTKPIVKAENCPNLSLFIYQQSGWFCSCDSRTGRCLPMAETPRSVIACETHGEPKEQLPPNTSRTGHIKTCYPAWFCASINSSEQWEWNYVALVIHI